MQYLLTFIEGIISFISPCILPMIPVYISYFAGGKEEQKLSRALKNAFGFVLGFTVVFVVLGLFAGTIGSFITKHNTVFNIITGLIVIFFALSFLGVFHLPFLNGVGKIAKKKDLGVFSAFIFGMVFSVSLTPCVGAFLGAALLQASQEGSAFKGGFMLVSYSLGLGIPFLLSAVLINQLKSAFTYIKKHYKIINTISGIFLILIGVLMMTGMMNILTALLT